MEKVIFISLIFFFSLQIQAQDSATLSSSKITGQYPRYKINGQKLSGKKLIEEINKIPKAGYYYKKSKTNKTLAYIMVVPMAISAFFLRPNDLSAGTPEYRRKETNSLIIGTLSAGSCIYFFLRSRSQLKKAVRIRNEKLGYTY